MRRDSREFRAARQVAKYARDADECRAFLEALGLLEYLVGDRAEDGSDSEPESMFTTAVRMPTYKIVSPDPKYL